MLKRDREDELIFRSGQLKNRISGAFRWFGLGSLLLAVTLFGAVSANGETASSGWQVIFLGTGFMGTLCIFFGLVILALNMHHLTRGGQS